MKTGFALGQIVRSNLAFFLSTKTRGSRGYEPSPPVSVPKEGFGICVASSEDPACDDLVVARLRDLVVHCVRVDYGYDSPGTCADRFIQRLLQEKFQVALHLVAPRKEMESLNTREGTERWRQFLRSAIKRFGGEVEFFEVGTTVNRRRWSGFTVPLFLRAWEIAWEEAQSAKVALAGPNVTDFEPFYNVAILDALRRRGQLPAIHTDNLFVERATEPEAFDHKMLGHKFAGVLKFNTIRKAQLLSAIGKWAGVPRTFSMHASWSLRRIQRVLEDAEEQQADYVTRYCCLTAISGGLDRVYWGPLIGQREGLIDDGTVFFPEVFHVTFYGRANGEVRNYRVRPAFRAFKTVNWFLPGTTFTKRIKTEGRLEIIEFQSAAHTLHVVWCRNGFCAPSGSCYLPETLAAAEMHDRDGNQLPKTPDLFTQRPVYLRWSRKFELRMRPLPGSWPNVRLSSGSTVDYALVETSDWRGLVLRHNGSKQVDIDTLLPHQLPKLDSASAEILRNKRNRVWAVTASWDPGRRIVVKHFRPPCGLRGWIQQFKQGKALRSWNGAHELLRRGVPTPQPVAWLEHPRHPRASESYYLCEGFDGGSSARQAFYAFNDGATEFLDVPKTGLYKAITEMVNKMHARGVFFRDLSAGNLLLRRNENGEIEFGFIDTGRLKTGRASLPIRQRLADLMRLCHPLVWREREVLLQAYFEAANLKFAPWMRLAFHYYDWKHLIKKKLRPWRRKSA